MLLIPKLGMIDEYQLILDIISIKAHFRYKFDLFYQYLINFLLKLVQI